MFEFSQARVGPKTYLFSPPSLWHQAAMEGGDEEQEQKPRWRSRLTIRTGSTVRAGGLLSILTILPPVLAWFGFACALACVCLCASMHGETLPLDMREAMMPHAKAWNHTKLLQATKETVAYCRRIPVNHTLLTTHSPPHAHTRIPPHTHTDEHTHTHTTTTNICTTTLAPCHTHILTQVEQQGCKCILPLEWKEV